MPNLVSIAGDPIGTRRSQIALGIVASAVVALLWAVSAFVYLPLLPPLAVLAVLLAVTQPAVTSIVFLTLTYFKFNELSPVLAPLSVLVSLGSGLVIVSLVWHLLLARSIRIEWRGPQACVLLLWVIATAGLLTAQTHSLAFQAWSDYSKTLLLALAILALVRTPGQLQLLVRLFVLGGLIVALCTALNAWSGEGLVEGSRAVAGDAALSNPNDLALILLLPLALAATSALARGSLFWRLISAVGAGWIGYAIILTQSRGGLFGFVTVFIIIASRSVRSRILPVIAGIILAAVLYAAMGISDRESGGAADEKGEAAHTRIVAWQAGMNMARTLPLTGVGIGNFMTEFSTYAPEETQHPYTAHSIWFLMLGELGVPGFLTFVTLVLASLAAGFRNVRQLAASRAPAALQSLALATLAGLAGFLVSGSFLSYVYQWPLYVVVILLVSVERVEGETQHPPSRAEGRQRGGSRPVPKRD